MAAILKVSGACGTVGDIVVPAASGGMKGDVIVLGRADDIPASHRLTHPKVSSRHCNVFAKPDGTLWLEDVSKNRTFVDGAPATRPLHKLAVGDVFYLLSPSKYGTADSNVVIGVLSPTGQKRSADDIAPDAKKAKLDNSPSMTDCLTCGVCLEVFYRPMALLPCMHNYCAHCLCGILDANHNQGGAFGSAPLMCGLCGQTVSLVAPNHTLQSAVEAHFSSRPDVARPDPAWTKQVDDTVKDSKAWSGWTDPKRDGCTGAITAIAASLANHAADSDDDESDSDSDGSDYSSGSGGGGGGGAVFGFTVAVQQATPAAGCTSSDATTLKAVSDIVLTELPTRAFGGSAVERSIFEAWLTSSGKTVQDVWVACRERMGSLLTPWDYTTGLTTKGSKVSQTCAAALPSLSACICEHCAKIVFAGLLYHYRRDIPNYELDSAVVARQDCWYGLECRTQHHKPDHAQRLNHVCPCTRQ